MNSQKHKLLRHLNSSKIKSINEGVFPLTAIDPKIDEFYNKAMSRGNLLATYDPIAYGSFFHWPPLKMGVSDIGKVDYVYISHIHEDHCSPGTIKHLNKDAEIIIMDREPKIVNYVKNFLKVITYKKKLNKVN